MGHPEIARQIDQSTQERLISPTVRNLYQAYCQYGLLDKLADIISYQPEQLRDPIIHTLATHVTKEKPVFIFGLSQSSPYESEVRQGVAASVDFLWALSLMYDDIVDNDTERAGKVAAWSQYGRERTLQSFRHGAVSVTNYLFDLLGPRSTPIVQKYQAQALESVSQVSAIELNTPTSQIIQNYAHRMSFHTNLPIELLFPNRSIQRRHALSAIFFVNFAGQVLNDIKDFSPQYVWLRKGFSDIRSGTVSFPIASTWQKMTADQQKKFSQIFGKQDLSDQDVKQLGDYFSPSVLAELKTQINGFYLQSLTAFGQITSQEIFNLAEEWINSKLTQLDGLYQ